MSAAEVIEQIKKLPPEERREVKAFMNDPSVGKDADASTPTVKFIPQKTFEAAKKKIFAENRELLRRLAE